MSTDKCKICGQDAMNWYPLEKNNPYFCDEHDPYPNKEKNKMTPREKERLQKLHEFMGEMKSKLEKIIKDIDRKPREFWIVESKTLDQPPEIVMWVYNEDPRDKGGLPYLGEHPSIIHVREVTE